LRRADAEHPAERAEDAAELWGGGEKRCGFGIGEEMAELGGAGGGFRHQAQQPGLAARQGERLGSARPGRAFRRRAGRGGRGCGGAREAGCDAAQPRPDQDDERAGEPAQDAAAPGNGLAQALDDEGEAVGYCTSGGGRSGLGHERK
jgi:hypothetical protein